MLRNIYAVCLCFAFFATAARGEWISLKRNAPANLPPQATIISDDNSVTVIRVELSGFELSEFAAAGKTYQSADLLNDIFTTEPGRPEVPYVAALLAVPDLAGISIDVIESAPAQSFTGIKLSPARPSWQEGDPEPPYVENPEAYQSSEIYPQISVKTDAPVIFRDFRLVRIAAYPVHYVPEKNELQVVPSMTIRVSYGAGAVINPKSTPRRPIAPSFAKVYRSSILNYQNVLHREYSGLESGRDVMLCIMPDSFYTRFQTYAQWKVKTGIDIKCTKFSQIGANPTNPDIIKNHIASAYNTWQYPPTYVLLVGDYGVFPIKLYNNTFAFEDYFVQTDGNDFFPEMFIGRFPNQNNYRLDIYTSKFIRYERTPYTINPNWLKSGICCSNRAYESQRTTKRFAAGMMMQAGGFISVDTLMSDNPCTMNLTTVINAINSGRGWLNYRGEGWSNGWWASCYPFSTSDVSSVNNGQMLTFVTSIGCGVAMFNVGSGNCFGEEWLGLGTTTAPRGAVAFIGATNNTHTTYNNKIDKGLYVGMFSEGMDTPGEGLVRGKLYMYNVYGTDPWVQYHYAIFCLLGDPSIHIWKDIPKPVTVTHQTTIPVGYSQLSFAVTELGGSMPVPNAQVTVSGDTTFLAGFTDSTGHLLLGITRETAGTLAVGVRGGNVVPYEGTISVVQATEYVAPLGPPTVVDLSGNLDGKINPNERCQISFRLKNWGIQTANNVTASLTLADSNHVVIYTTTPAGYGNLAPGASASGTPFEFFVRDTCPVGYNIPFDLHVTSGTSTRDFIMEQLVRGPNLTYVNYLVNDSGSVLTNGRMDPGESVFLSLTVSNTGEDLSPNVRGILRSADPFITITDSISSFGTLLMGASATNTGDPFGVTVSAACSLRHSANYEVQLATQNGLYPYSIMRTLAIPVGQPTTADPTGPDSYGYYGYSSDDTLFQQCPTYSWYEIQTLGTLVPRNPGGDFTITVTLPFNFRYYGMNYNQCRISSDGWIAFGSGTQVAYANHPLPYNDNVSCMVAPFWDDFYSSNAADTGKLYYYNDAANHRFIVEWCQVSHYSNYQDRESFQVILRDPMYYPTPTGDGDIIMQYRIVDEPSSNTVGIENHAQTVGLQYVYEDAYDETATRLKNEFAIRWTTVRPTRPTNVKDKVEIPTEFALWQNFPNPFNPSTSFKFALPLQSSVILEIYNILGQRVRLISAEEMEAGYHTLRWDGTSDVGFPLGSGMYILRLKAIPAGAREFAAVRKLLLVK